MQSALEDFKRPNQNRKDRLIEFSPIQQYSYEE